MKIFVKIWFFVIKEIFIYIAFIFDFRVRLAINRKTQEAVAVKIVNQDKLAGNKDSLKKEVCLLCVIHHFIKERKKPRE